MKFKQRLLSALTALSLTASLFPTTALADVDGNLDGSTNSNAGTADGYGYPNNGAFGWRIDAYVSTNTNGKIDRDNDSIGTDALPWVGAVMYEPFNSYDYTDVYLSIERTNELRNATFSSGLIAEYVDGYPTGTTQWALPNVTKVDENKGVYFLEDNSPIAHITTSSTYNPIGLPLSPKAYDSNSAKVLVQDKIEDHDNLTKILSDINASLGGNDDNWNPLYTAVGAKGLGSQVLDKLNAAIAEKGTEAYGLLLPNSVDPTTKEENCIVEWCLVLTPVFNWKLMFDDENRGFWECYVDGKYTLLEEYGHYISLGLDAYQTAQYNETTKVMYNSQNQAASLADIKAKKLKYSLYNGNICQYWSSGPYTYSTYGKLYAETLYGVEKVYQAAYDTHTKNAPPYVYCGVPIAGWYLQHTGKGTFPYTNFKNTDDAADYAKYGGIAVFDNEISDPGIPVYYYVYDPNNPDADPEIVTTSYTPKDGTTTFTPSTDTGLPTDCTVVAMEFA